MGIWGKIFGGAAGRALGGPIGRLLSTVLGHAADTFRKEPARDGERAADATREIAFTIGLIVLSAKMAKADGQVTRNEVAAFRQIFHVPESELANVGRVFNQARKDSRGFEPYARQIAKLFDDRHLVLEDVLHALFHIAKADGVVHEAELTYLRRVAEIFGFSEEDFAAIRAQCLGGDAVDAYQALGLRRDASDQEVRAAYRRLMREHHPDRLIAAGLPEERIQMATETVAQINAAYERIRAERGLNRGGTA